MAAVECATQNIIVMPGPGKRSSALPLKNCGVSFLLGWDNLRAWW
jgi:hypothetical protein